MSRLSSLIHRVGICVLFGTFLVSPAAVSPSTVSSSVVSPSAVSPSVVSPLLAQPRSTSRQLVQFLAQGSPSQSPSSTSRQRDPERDIGGRIELKAPFDQGNIQAQKDFAVGMAQFEQKNYELAIDYLRRALTGASGNDNIRFFLGLAFYHAGYTENAIAQWENIFKLRGPDPILEARINAAYRSQLQEPTLRQNPLSATMVFHSELSLLNIFQGSASRRAGVLLPTAVKSIGSEQILVMDAKSGLLLLLDGDGRLKKELVGLARQSLQLSAELKGPADLVVLGQNNYVVSDFRGDTLVWLDGDGNVLRTLPQQNVDTLQMQLRGPMGISLDSSGNLLVVDSVSGNVKRYSQQGDLLGSFGTRGSLTGTLNVPSDVIYDPRSDKNYVVDQGKREVLQFDRNGFFEKSFRNPLLRNPSRIATNPYASEELLVLDNEQLYKLNTAQGTFTELLEQTNIGNRYFLSFDVDVEDGMLLAGNVYKPAIERYVRPANLRANLQVLFEGVELKNFPKVVVRVNVRDALSIPKRNLQKRNFSILERGLSREIELLGREVAFESFAPVVLIEKGPFFEENKLRVESFLTQLLTSSPLISRATLIAYGGTDASFTPVGAETTLYAQSIERLIALPNHREFSLRKALKSAINRSITTAFRPMILIVATSPHGLNEVGGNSYQQLLDFAHHNHIPISVAYLGRSDEWRTQTMTYLKQLANITGGISSTYTPNLPSAIMQHNQNYHDGLYLLSFDTTSSARNAGDFRKVEVRVRHLGQTGRDDRGGYTVPLP